MTPSEKARRVAEIAGYDWLDGGSIYVRKPGNNPWILFNPRHDANQAIEALNRVFPEWRHDTWTASDGVRYHLITGGKSLISDTEPKYSSQPQTSFGAAAVAVILAAGGKK